MDEVIDRVNPVKILLAKQWGIMNSSLSQEADSSVTTKPARLYYLDWLRVLAMVPFYDNG